MKIISDILFIVILVLQVTHLRSLQYGLSEDIGKGAGGVIKDIGNAAEDILDKSSYINDIEDHGIRNEHKDHESQSSYSNSSDKTNAGEHHDGNDRKHHGGKKTDPFGWAKIGHGIDWKSGRSEGGIRTPFFDLLGLSRFICRVTYAAEHLIENLGEFHVKVDKRIGEVDRSIVNYVTDKYIMRVVDLVRRNHIAFVGFLVDTHIVLDRLIYNTIIEAYRITKFPVRELFACH